MTACHFFGMESNPMELRAWREWIDWELPEYLAGSVFSLCDFLKISDHDNAPALASVFVVTVDLEAGHRTRAMRELGAWSGAKDYRLLTDRIVDRKDLRTPAHHDRQPPQPLGSQILPALFLSEWEHCRRGRPGSGST